MSFSEIVSKAAETISTEVKDLSKFNPDKRVERVGNLEDSKKASFDSDKKVEVSANSRDTENEAFDPDKRVEIKNAQNGEVKQTFDPDKRAENIEKKSEEKYCLSEDEKKLIKEKTGWSDDITSNIGSIDETRIYMDAGLKETEINGKKCLIQEDIDWNKTDDFGRTNKERSQQGLAPLDKNGKPFELHHIGQKADSSLAELTQEQHRGKGNDSILHDKKKESEIDRHAFASVRASHWESRAYEINKGDYLCQI